MLTFIIGLIILAVGGFFYSAFVAKIFRPDDRKTPAVEFEDGVDFVPMSKWKNSLINLLNISGTGPILGPIQGILFGPIAFITIPIGCVISGATHDYLSGMMSMRQQGKQMPKLVEKFLGKKMYLVYLVVLVVLLLLVVAVFTYTPGDIFIGQILNQSSSGYWMFIVYGAILFYYILASAYPIDKIIGRVYPIFGLILILSTVLIFIALFFNSSVVINDLDLDHGLEGIFGLYPMFDAAGNSGVGTNFIPAFFVTVACGITSGFHSTQNTMIARSVTHEKEGKVTFYWMMIAEGFIAMVWAGAAMALYNTGSTVDATTAIGDISKMLLGPVGAFLAIVGVIVLPITSGDTALRSCRLIISEHLYIDQTVTRNRVMMTLALIVIPVLLVVYVKTDPTGFNTIWRYFAWTNQTVAVFAFATAAIYLVAKKSSPRLAFLIALVPGSFYTFIISSYILNAKIGFNLSYDASYIIAGLLTLAYFIAVAVYGRRYASGHTEE